MLGKRVSYYDDISGTVIDIRGPNHGDYYRFNGRLEREILVRWDNSRYFGSRECWIWKTEITVDMVSEDQLKAFLEDVEEGIHHRVGIEFLSRVGYQHSKLWNERCPGKAVKMILEGYT